METNQNEGRFKLIVVTYNSQGFIGYFILNQLYRKGISPQQIVNRAKLLCSELTPFKMIFIGRLNFFPCLWRNSSRPLVCRRRHKACSPTSSIDPTTKRMRGLCPTSIITTQTAGTKNVATPLTGGTTVIT